MEAKDRDTAPGHGPPESLTKDTRGHRLAPDTREIYVQTTTFVSIGRTPEVRL